MVHLTIGLSFPYSTEKNELINIFYMSCNDALQSEFLKPIIFSVLENSDSLSKSNYKEIEIPWSLYRGLRYCDLKMLIKIWKGEEVYNKQGSYVYNDERYCFPDIARVTQSLLLSENIPSVRYLEEDYPTYPYI